MHVLFWFDMMIVLEQQQRIIHWTLVSGKHILYKSACEENSLKLLHTLSCICWKVARNEGITKSISRYPTAEYRFDTLMKALEEDLAENDGLMDISQSAVPPGPG